MSTLMHSVRRVAAGAVGAGAIAGALTFGAAPAAQATPAAPSMPYSTTVQLADGFNPAAVSTGLPDRADAPNVLPMWWHHHHHWWNPWRWWWWW